MPTAMHQQQLPGVMHAQGQPMLQPMPPSLQQARQLTSSNYFIIIITFWRPCDGHLRLIDLVGSLSLPIYVSQILKCLHFVINSAILTLLWPKIACKQGGQNQLAQNTVS